jgi:glutamate-1-semialdehyde 2,1-aminomutase
LKHPHSGTFSANPVSTTAGRIAMEMFDEQAVLDLNTLTNVARNQIEEVIKLADVPVCLTGAGSMFRMHFQENAPNTYRETYQNKETRDVINELLDFLFFEEDIVMINTMACMFATSLKQSDVDRLSDALLRGLRFMKPKIDRL